MITQCFSSSKPGLNYDLTIALYNREATEDINVFKSLSLLLLLILEMKKCCRAESTDIALPYHKVKSIHHNLFLSKVKVPQLCS